VAKNEKRSLAAIEAEIEKLKREAAALRAAEVAEVVAKIKTAIDAYGLTAADLGFVPRAGRKAKASLPGRPGGKSSRSAARGKAGTRQPKYADGNGNTWVGQGKRPGWFVAALAAGKSPEDLLVKTGA
jgi:DNA-binding protein H-NS